MSVATVKSKASKSPDDNYSVAMCDGCKAQCEASKVPGKVGPNARSDAHGLAKAAGWIERITPDPNKRRRKFFSYVNLFCPECAAGEGQGDAEAKA